MTIQRLSLNVQTLYAQLVEQATTDDLTRNIGNLSSEKHLAVNRALSCSMSTYCGQ